MQRLLMKICYDGSGYHGWQVQQNAPAVQPAVQDALAAVIGTRPGITGCSRTDSGVHANAYYFHFDYDGTIAPNALIRAINTKLPRDIAALECAAVPDSFHARYSVISKRYIYKIYNAPVRNPFYENRALHYPHKLDESLLDLAAKQFIGKYDFVGFSSAGSSVSDTVRTVLDAEVFRQGDTVIFSVVANGFLYNMVRIMTGTLLSVAEGKIIPDDISGIIKSKNRASAGITAPPQGLYLDCVCYEGIEI